MKIVYCFEKIEKSVDVSDKFIIPYDGQKICCFNEFLTVHDIINNLGVIYIKLKR